jgi:hypothetical protein
MLSCHWEEMGAMKISRLLLLAVTEAALLLSSCSPTSNPQAFTDAVRGAQTLVLHEGLPHQMFERDLVEEERRTKAVQDFHGYAFYEATLDLSEEDANRLTQILSDPSTFKPFSGEKKCGGFHPDYAVEWQDGDRRYWALLCFGCHEVKLFGPGIESRNDLEANAYSKLQVLLKNHRKNRPDTKPQ